MCSIVFLHPFIEGGVVEYYMLKQAIYLANKGHNTYMLCTNITPRSKLFDVNLIRKVGSKVKIIMINYKTISLLRYQIASISQISKLAPSLMKLIEGRNIVLYIHNHGAPLWYINMISALRMAGKELSIVFHPWFHPWKPKSKASTLLMLNKLIAKMAKVIIANSHVEAIWITKYLNSNKKILICYPGVDIPSVSCSSRPILDKEYILFVGRIEPRKGLHALFLALPKLVSWKPDLRLVMVGSIGDNHYYVKLFNYLRYKGLSKLIIHLSRVPRSELASLYANAIALVHPSHFEAFGFTIVEAMKLSLPPIVTPTGIAPEVIEDGFNGYLLHYAHPRAVYDYNILPVNPLHIKHKIMTIYKNRETLGINARESVKDKFSWNSCLRKIEGIIDRIMRGERV